MSEKIPACKILSRDIFKDKQKNNEEKKKKQKLAELYDPLINNFITLLTLESNLNLILR